MGRGGMGIGVGTLGTMVERGGAVVDFGSQQ